MSTGHAPASTAAPDDATIRRLAKLEDNRPLTPSELHRALNDALDEGYELFDLSNREARFALILMGGLNAALVIAASQTSFGAQLSAIERRIEGAAVALYALLAVWFLLQAIDALRPGHFRPHFDRWPRQRDDFPMGIRYYEDVVGRDTESHWEAWRSVTLRQLNAELAVQVHSLSLKNNARRLALRRLYNSLRVMTIVFSGILVLFLVFTLT